MLQSQFGLLPNDSVWYRRDELGRPSVQRTPISLVGSEIHLAILTDRSREPVVPGMMGSR